MSPYPTNNKKMIKNIRKAISIIVIATFIGTSIKPPAYAQAMGDQNPRLPAPGVMIHLSPEFTPAYLKGIVIHPEDALRFDFIVYKGDEISNDAQKKEEYTKLIKYFLASLAVPDDNQWVNLSPYEKNRIIEDDFGKTLMGRDLLAQDYILKQITASLIYPQDKLGEKFWNRVYSRAYQQFKTTEIPVNTFNKVWIVPDEAVIHEKGNMAYVIKNHLKVMLEEDYLSLEKHTGIQVSQGVQNSSHTLASQVVREIVLPELEKEVNEGKNFAMLRQVFSGMILATWYKRVLKESLLGKIYMNQARLKGVDQNPQNNQKIYQQYLRAFKKGVFNYIKEDVDKYTNETIPRKYFSGGVENKYPTVLTTAAMTSEDISRADASKLVVVLDQMVEPGKEAGRLAAALAANQNGHAAMLHHLSESELSLLREPDEIAGFKAIRPWDSLSPSRIRNQIIQIEMALGNTAGAEATATRIAQEVALNPKKNFKGEEVHILNGVGPEAKVIGRIDRKIAEKYGYIHETANIVFVDPDGRALVQERVKDNYDQHISYFGGHLTVGQSHEEAEADESKQEFGMDQFASPAVFVGYEGYNSPEDTNKERRSWFVQEVTRAELEERLRAQAQEDQEMGIDRNSMTRQEVRDKMKQWQASHADGRGEVLDIHPIRFEDIENAESKLNDSSPYVDQQTHFLPVTTAFNGQRETTDLFFTPDAMDRLLAPENTDLWANIKRVAGHQAMLPQGAAARPRAVTKMRIMGQDIEFREGGNVTIDISRAPVATKRDAMEDFLKAGGFRPEDGYYIGNQTQSIKDRDGVMVTLTGLKVKAVDEKQETVVAGADRIGVGPQATLTELRRINGLSDGDLPKFIGFDVDDTLLGVRPDNTKEELDRDRREIAQEILTLGARGVRTVIFSDNDSKRAFDVIAPALKRVSDETGVRMTNEVTFYASGMATKFTVNLDQQNRAYDENYNSQHMISPQVANLLQGIIGDVSEDAQGNVIATGLLGESYTRDYAVRNAQGKYVLNPNLPPHTQLRANVTPGGNVQWPSLQIRDRNAQGAVAQLAVRQLASGASEERLDIRRQLLERLVKAAQQAEDKRMTDEEIAKDFKGSAEYGVHLQEARLARGLADPRKYHDVVVVLVKANSLEPMRQALERGKGKILPLESNVVILNNGQSVEERNRMIEQAMERRRQHGEVAVFVDQVDDDVEGNLSATLRSMKKLKEGGVDFGAQRVVMVLSGGDGKRNYPITPAEGYGNKGLVSSLNGEPNIYQAIKQSFQIMGEENRGAITMSVDRIFGVTQPIQGLGRQGIQVLGSEIPRSHREWDYYGKIEENAEGQLLFMHKRKSSEERTYLDRDPNRQYFPANNLTIYYYRGDVINDLVGGRVYQQGPDVGAKDQDVNQVIGKGTGNLRGQGLDVGFVSTGRDTYITDLGSNDRYHVGFQGLLSDGVLRQLVGASRIQASKIIGDGVKLGPSVVVEDGAVILGNTNIESGVIRQGAVVVNTLAAEIDAQSGSLVMAGYQPQGKLTAETGKVLSDVPLIDNGTAVNVRVQASKDADPKGTWTVAQFHGDNNKPYSYADLGKLLDSGGVQSRLGHAAMLPTTHAFVDNGALKGGIDFNAANLNLQIKRDGKGVPLPVGQQNFENIKIAGLLPFIIDIIPATSLPIFSKTPNTV